MRKRVRMGESRSWGRKKKDGGGVKSPPGPKKMKDRVAHSKNERNNMHINDDEGVNMVCDGLTMAEGDID